MSDVIISILQFPNDPTNNRTAHQMFVATQTDCAIDLYSISSIPGKEKRVFGPDKDDYVTILSQEAAANGFRVPSFIDCTKMYRVSISAGSNISALTQRSMTSELHQRGIEKINQKMAEGKQVQPEI